MGHTYCMTLCGDRTTIEQSALSTLVNPLADEPLPTQARRVSEHIELHARIKETYMLFKTNHVPERRGVKLQLHYIFRFAAYYEGEWKNGLPHGFGKIIYDDGSMYEGCFNAGMAECQHALFIRCDGSFYRGSIRQNRANGYGELSTARLFLKGQWLNDLPHGKARQVYSTVSFYEGQFVQGVKEGRGIYQWNERQFYQGSFHSGRIDGRGQLVTREYTYRGQFRDNKKHGNGIYLDHQTGFSYNGRFEEDKPCGKGQIVYSDGASFRGEFNGFQNRRGSLTLVEGQVLQIDVRMDQQKQSDRVNQQCRVQIPSMNCSTI